MIHFVHGKRSCRAFLRSWSQYAAFNRDAKALISFTTFERAMQAVCPNSVNSVWTKRMETLKAELVLRPKRSAAQSATLIRAKRGQRNPANATFRGHSRIFLRKYESTPAVVKAKSGAEIHGRFASCFLLRMLRSLDNAPLLIVKSNRIL